MDNQLTIRITAEFSEALDRASRRTGMKRSELVRQALRSYLEAPVDARPPAARVRHLLGSLESGIPDLAERHREYVLESLNRGVNGQNLLTIWRTIFLTHPWSLFDQLVFFPPMSPLCLACRRR